MKKILFFMIISQLILSADSQTQTTQKEREAKQLKIDMEKEKKFAKEQVFYMGEDYNLKGAEVNPDSLKNIKELENLDDFDMNDVYD
jgi:hypothetical protein